MCVREMERERVCVCVHFKPSLVNPGPCVHSLNTPLLPFSSLSASQLNEVNKLKRLLPPPTLFPSCASPPPPLLPPPLVALLLILLSLPRSFISAEALYPPFLTSFCYCHCCVAKALGFPPCVSQDRAAITAQERRRPAV